MPFGLYIGIDYSGAKTSRSRLRSLQVYEAGSGDEPRAVMSPASQGRSPRNWNRMETAEFLIEKARSDTPFIAGLDHGFSFPESYFQRYGIRSWTEFLEDFCKYWPLNDPDTAVDAVRRQQPERIGSMEEFRLTEKWTPSAKSVFQFDVQGQVAKSTHCGIPWLRVIREAAGKRVHFWPFDGWQVPEGRSVISEVYPSIFRRRYPREDRTADQHDAYAIARWLGEADRRGALQAYFAPPLTAKEKELALKEGWILGVW